MTCLTLRVWMMILTTEHDGAFVKRPVSLTASGGHGSVGKYELGNGYGAFDNVTNINQVLGTYNRAAAHTVVAKDAQASAMAKGGIALVISGSGTGWNVGAGFPSFAIEALE